MTTETIWGQLPGSPAFGSNHQGCRRIKRGDPLPDGWYIVHTGSIYQYIKPVSELANMKGGPKHLWLRLHKEEVLAFCVKHGYAETKNRFCLKTETLEALLEGGSQPFVLPFTPKEKLESRVEILHEDVRCLRKELAETKEAFASFQQQVAGQITDKFLIPLLQAGIELKDTPEATKSKSGRLQLATIANYSERGSYERTHNQEG
jgi:hypothetical protein